MRTRFVFRPGNSILTFALLISSVLSAPAMLSIEIASGGNDEKRLLRLHNKERKKRNLPRLRFRGGLNRAAQNYALVMAENDHFSHTGPDGSTFDERIKKEEKGLKSMGENLAYGQRTATKVHKAWMKSHGHRKNILSRNFKYVGFGKAGEEPYWATSFGG